MEDAVLPDALGASAGPSVSSPAPRQSPVQDPVPPEPVKPNQPVPTSLNNAPAAAPGTGAAAPVNAPPKNAAQASPRKVLTMKRTGQPGLSASLHTRTASHSSNVPIPAPATPLASGSKPEPAKVTSDVVATPTSASTTPPVAVVATPSNMKPSKQPNSAPGALSKPADKEQRDIARRNALRAALKKRWASGSMDHVHQKRMQTLKLRKQQAELEDAVLHKDKGVGGVQKPRSASHSALTRRTSLKSKELARLFSQDHPPKRRSLHRSRLSEPMDTYGTSELQSPASGISDTEMADASTSRRDVDDFDLNGGFINKDDEDDGDWEGSDSSGRSPVDKTRELSRLDGPPPHLEDAAPGRSYKIYIDESGTQHRTGGALIPEGYQLSTATPGFPWVCPVRTCRRLFSGLRPLGTHFVNLHRGSILHDNQDGTFSLRGQYDPCVSGLDKKPALVISRGPADVSEAPPVDPSVNFKPYLEMQEPTPELPHALAIPDEDLRGTPRGTKLTMKEARKRVQPVGDWKAPWSYLQQYLIRHKGPTLPEKGYVKQLICFPRVRELEWNQSWLDLHPFLDSQPRDVSALIIQLTGDPAPSPCRKCAEGRGPFKGCIMISSKAPTGPLMSVFSCANCFYHYGQTYCSHKAWGERRANEILAKRNEVDVLPTDPSPDMESDPQVEDKPVEAEGVVESGVSTPDPLEDSAVPDGYVPIEMAEPGRRYDMWPDETGTLAPTSGALLPAGYTLSTAVRQRPWICPLRTCRQLFVKKPDLGYHFQRAHFACLLNDNGDGTLSSLGVYSQRHVSRGGRLLTKAYPIVISRNLTGHDERLLEPRLPNHLAPKLALPATSTQTKKVVTEGNSKETLNPTAPSGGDPKALWEYIRPHLVRTTEIPHKGYAQELLRLPRVRDLEFNKFRNATIDEKAQRDIAAIIIQLTGEESPKICTRCRDNKGIFGRCVVIARTAFPEARSRYISCANCLYHGTQTFCNLKEWVLEREQPPFQRHYWAGGRALTDRGRDHAQRARSMSRSSTLEDPGSKLASVANEAPSYSQSRRYVDPEPNTSIPDVAEVDMDMSCSPPVRSFQPNRPTRNLRHTASAQPAQPSQAARPIQTPPLITPGAIQPADILEMETWEVAPGRIRESLAANPENIAFSKAYLSTNQVVSVCEDVSFHVDTIRSGATLQIEADVTKTRLCSVAAGKLRVRTGDEPEFTIGPHGMFKVKSGTACAVQNWMYVDAILHVTVLSEFM